LCYFCLHPSLWLRLSYVLGLSSRLFQFACFFSSKFLLWLLTGHLTPCEEGEFWSDEGSDCATSSGECTQTWMTA
jgi:hypothetical protein